MIVRITGRQTSPALRPQEPTHPSTDERYSQCPSNLECTGADDSHCGEMVGFPQELPGILTRLQVAFLQVLRVQPRII